MITELFRSPAERRRAAAFADLLEGRRADGGHELKPLLALAASLRAVDAAPSSDFSAALRARLVQETAQRSATPRLPSQRTVAVAEPRSHRIRQAVAAVTAVALLGGAGAATASTRALPGDSLYGLKRGLESVQLSLAGSELARGRELLEQADSRLGEAERLVASGGPVETDTRAQIGQVLAEMQVALRKGSELITEVYEQTGDVAALELLDRFVLDQQQRLDVLMERLAGIDPGLVEDADATMRLLDSLHADVLAVTRSAQAVNNAGQVTGAARDLGASGDGWAVSRVTEHLVPSQTLVGGTGISPSSGETPAGSSATGEPGLIGDATGAEATTVVATPVVPSLGSTTAVVPTLPTPPPAATGAPCVPVPPLTTC